MSSSSSSSPTLSSSFSTLFLLSFSLFLSSFLFGLAPLHLTLSSRSIDIISSGGVGLLLGTALIVIIPEGVHTFYKIGEDHSGHSHGGEEGPSHIHSHGEESQDGVYEIEGPDDALYSTTPSRKQSDHIHKKIVKIKPSLSPSSSPSTPHDHSAHADGEEEEVESDDEPLEAVSLPSLPNIIPSPLPAWKDKLSQFKKNSPDEGKEDVPLSFSSSSSSSLPKTKTNSEIHSHSDSDIVVHSPQDNDINNSVDEDGDHDHDNAVVHSPHENELANESNERKLLSIPASSSSHSHSHSSSSLSPSPSPTPCHSPVSSPWVGACLALGFVFMFIVDRLSGGHSHTHAHASPTDIQNNTSNGIVTNGHSHGNGANGSSVAAAATHSVHQTLLSNRQINTKESDVEMQNIPTSTSPSSFPPSHDSDDDSTQSKSRSSPLSPFSYFSCTFPPLSSLISKALIGILVHSAVDGVALGAISSSPSSPSASPSPPASSSSSSSSLSSSASPLTIVVFLAILLHKAPMAFGYSSFLLLQGKAKYLIRAQLVIFCLAAPVSALVTYVILSTIGDVSSTSSPSVSSSSSFFSSSPPWKAHEWVGAALIFSGGTFLFTIAAHILPEINKIKGEEEGHGGSHGGHSHSHAPSSGNASVDWPSLLSLIGGILLPLLLPHAH